MGGWVRVDEGRSLHLYFDWYGLLGVLGHRRYLDRRIASLLRVNAALVDDTSDASEIVWFWKCE